VAYAKSSENGVNYGQEKSFYLAPDLKPTNGITYVSETPKGTGNGSSWENATAILQQAINNSGKGNQVWVSKGTYLVNYPFPKSIEADQYFVPKNGVNVYGGFYGNETSINERKTSDSNSDGITDVWEFSNQVILSSKFSDKSNGYHVLYQEENFPDTTRWNGFTFQDGRATGKSNHGMGGGVFLKNNLTLDQCIIQNNSTQRDGGNGGGVYLAGGTIINSLVGNNSTSKSTSYGGGIYLKNGFISKCTITNNFTSNSNSGGGGIYIKSDSVKNCIVSYNHTSGESSDGAGIYLESGNLSNCSVSNNHTSGYGLGGGIFVLNGTILTTIVENNFTQFTGSEGGGIKNNYGNFTNCIIRNNYTIGVSAKGGGISSYLGQIQNCTITNNHTQGKDALGGGIFNFYSSFRECKVISNYTSGDNAPGGGIWNIGEFVNCLINNNQTNGSNSNGGGLFCNGSIHNCTITNNLVNGLNSSGGGVYTDNLYMTNSIVWGNKKQNEWDQINQLIGVENCAIQGLSSISNNNQSLSQNNKEGNGPAFMNPSKVWGIAKNSTDSLALLNSDWSLQSRSVCIDSGQDYSFTFDFSKDLAGNPRKMNSKIDLGAYEFQFSRNLVPIAEAGPNQKVCLLVEVVLDASASYDPEKNNLTYEWYSNEGITINNNQFKHTLHYTITIMLVEYQQVQ